MNIIKNNNKLIILLFLIISAFTVYWQVTDYDFISFDDNTYVYENDSVIGGLNRDTIFSAFSIIDLKETYWHPLSTLSHMLDCELYGLNAGMHHLSNLLFHIANVLILFLVLTKMTNELWKSAIVAALFGLHPVNVDSVAWIAERKNLLSTFFWMLTMLAYAYYTQKPTVSRYIAMFCLFVFGLLSKPMLVTLPFVFLLLDHWPLKRFHVVVYNESQKDKKKIRARYQYQGVAFSRLILEKVPLIIISLVTIFVSSLSIKLGGNTVTTEMVPMGIRVENAIVSYVGYLWKMIWPANLTVYYPYPDMIPIWKVVGSLGILMAISLLAVKFIFRAPYFIVGWLWFLGTLVPVSGIMQGGLWPAIAERWAYVPYVGLFIVIVWVSFDLVSGLRHRRLIISMATFFMLSVLAILTWQQAGYWKNNFTLFEHAIEVNPRNFIANNNLGVAYKEKGDIHKALDFFNKSISATPRFSEVHYNMANVLMELDENGEALKHYYAAVNLKPTFIKPYIKLGQILLDQGNYSEAINIYTNALQINPGSKEISNNLGAALAKQGQTDDAIRHFSKSIIKDSNNAFAYNNLGILLLNKGKMDEAMNNFSMALKRDNNYAEAHTNLATLLYKKGEIEKSTKHFLQAVQIDPENEKAHYNLGVIFSNKKDIKRAIDHLNEAIRINPENASSHFALALFLGNNENLDDAIVHYQKALMLDNDFEEAKKMLTNTRERKNKIDSDIFKLENELTKDANDMNNLQKLAVLYKMKGDYEKALSYLQKITAIDTDNPDVLYNIACIYSKQNNINESLNYLKKAIENGFNNWGLLQKDEDLENIRDSELFIKMVPAN